MNFFSLFLSFLSIHRAQQPRRSGWPSMYFGGSVVGNSSTIGIGISLTPPLIFTGGQKVRNLASFKTSRSFEQPVFENASRYSETKVQCCDNRPIFWPSLVKLGPRTPEKARSVMTQP